MSEIATPDHQHKCRCGRQFVAQQGLAGHIRHCAIARAPGQSWPGVQAPAPVAQPTAPAPAPVPAPALPAAPAVPPGDIAFATPPPMPPSNEAEPAKVIPRMPPPANDFNRQGVRMEQWSEPAAWAHPTKEKPAGWRPPAPAPPAVEPDAAAPDPEPAPPNDVPSDGDQTRQLALAKVLIVGINSRLGPKLDPGEEGLLTEAMPGKLGKASGIAAVITLIVLPRVLEHPVYGAKIAAMVEKMGGWFSGDGQPAPQAPQRRAQSARQQTLDVQAEEPEAPQPPPPAQAQPAVRAVAPTALPRSKATATATATAADEWANYKPGAKS